MIEIGLVVLDIVLTRIYKLKTIFARNDLENDPKVTKIDWCRRIPKRNYQAKND